MGKWKGPPHWEIQRCGARTRSGGSCGHFSMPNGRCRYHGGKSIGAKQPRIKHGYYTKENVYLRKQVFLLIEDSDKLLNKF